MNLDHNFWKKSLTPLVIGGVDIMNFDGDMGTYDFSGNNLCYNLGVGVRWDINDSIFVKRLYRWLWTELDGTDDEMKLDGFYFAGGA